MSRSRFRSIGKAMVIVVALGTLTMAAYVQHPLFAELPQGERLARIARSSNHADEKMSSAASG